MSFDFQWLFGGQLLVGNDVWGGDFSATFIDPRCFPILFFPASPSMSSVTQG
jgi:hypothetical protein